MPKIDLNAAPGVSSLVSTRRASASDFGGGASDSIFAAKQYGSMANKTVMTSGQSMPGYFY
jgi:hypothetical protein